MSQSSPPRIVSIQVGMPREEREERSASPARKRWMSGFHKVPVAGPVRLGRLTVEGDGQADLRVHGGPDRPVLAYCADHYDRWHEELGGDRAPYGAFGENLTLSGLDENDACLGDQYRIGPARVEVSQPRQPCWKLAHRWRNDGMPALVIRHNRGGWYFRVLEEGVVEAGMALERVARPYPRWTVARANDVMYRRLTDPAAIRDLAALPPLSADWREHFAGQLLD